jgi:hypothetical protein
LVEPAEVTWMDSSSFKFKPERLKRAFWVCVELGFTNSPEFPTGSTKLLFTLNICNAIFVF